jgi:hypothetical protein
MPNRKHCDLLFQSNGVFLHGDQEVSLLISFFQILTTSYPHLAVVDNISQIWALEDHQTSMKIEFHNGGIGNCSLLYIQKIHFSCREDRYVLPFLFKLVPGWQRMTIPIWLVSTEVPACCAWTLMD